MSKPLVRVRLRRIEICKNLSVFHVPVVGVCYNDTLVRTLSLDRWRRMCQGVVTADCGLDTWINDLS